MDDRTAPTTAVTPNRQIRARYDDATITVYQAFRPAIAAPAARDGRFPDAFSRSRMTWIKPSFLWTMHRSSWSGAPGQEHVLAVTVRREDFHDALRDSAPSSHRSDLFPERADWREALRGTSNRVQWDPERDVRMNPLPFRSLQLGLGGATARAYADEWEIGIEDVTATAHRVRDLVGAGEVAAASELLPGERPYPLPRDIRI